MNSYLAAALRLILPLLLRWAIVDFFGTDEDVDLIEDRFEVILGFAEVPLVLFPDEERVDERDDEMRPFCAINPYGRRSVSANKPRAMRRSIYNFLVVVELVVGIIESPWSRGKINGTAKIQVSFGSTNVFSVIPCLQFGHRAASVRMNSYGPRLPLTSARIQSNGISAS
jgi:hypothetical protein